MLPFSFLPRFRRPLIGLPPLLLLLLLLLTLTIRPLAAQTVDPTYAAFNTRVPDLAYETFLVRALATDAAGRTWVGGSFDFVGATRRGSLARLLPSGAPDPAFNPGGFLNVDPPVFERSGCDASRAAAMRSISAWIDTGSPATPRSRAATTTARSGNPEWR